MTHIDFSQSEEARVLPPTLQTLTITLNVSSSSLKENLEKLAKEKDMSVEQMLTEHMQETLEYVYNPEVPV
jgi:hypothetical protein